MATAPDADVVLVPAGDPIEVAAAWVGRACWAELAVHELLGAWLAQPADDDGHALAWWSIRAARAEQAEAWHRRLPELRELPRPSFVAARSSAADQLLVELAGVGSGDRPGALVAVLVAMRAGYLARAEAARGPADGPVAATLVRAVEAIDRDLARCAPLTAAADWTARLAEVGGMP